MFIEEIYGKKLKKTINCETTLSSVHQLINLSSQDIYLS